MNETTHLYTIFETADGYCGIAWTDMGIARLTLPTRSAESAERHLLRRLPHAAPSAPAAEAARAIMAVKQYFTGQQMDFSDIRLDLDGQDELFKYIYVGTRRVGWGRTTTYGTLAEELGIGLAAARDVGEAMARNPVPLIIPCHRVLAAGGKVGGFSAPGGSATKIRMLKLEGIVVGPPRPAQQSFAL